jgi:hypothetical protein
MAEIDINALTEEQLRQLEDRLARLPPPKPFESGWKPHDYSENVCAIDPRRPPQWAMEMMKANREAGVDAAMAAEVADRMRPKVPSPPMPGPLPERGSGWGTAVPIGPPPGIAAIDAMCAAQDAADRRERIGRMSPAERVAEMARLRSEIERATKEASHDDQRTA